MLNQEEGKYWDAMNKEHKTVCNRINNGDASNSNFLSEDIVNAVKQALTMHEQTKSGMIDKDRLFNNLLSSQPLAFNFFGWLKFHKDIAFALMKTIRPDITEIEDMVFEYAPASTHDKSAFDIGIIVKTDSQRGFIGLECKYTDTFSYKRPKSHTFYGDEKDRNYSHYRALYDGIRNRFIDDYFSYGRNSYFNQLYRNELLGVQLQTEFDFVVTGLFCYYDYIPTIVAVILYGRLIGNGIDDFAVLTYADYFENIQRLNLSWQQRELVMMLWARYCGLELSKKLIKST